MSQPAPELGTRLEELVAQLCEAEAKIVGKTGGSMDAVIDPQTGRLHLLRPSQELLLRAAERHFRLLERISAVVYEVAPDGRILYASDTFTSLTGYSPAELVGKNAPDLFTPGELRRQANGLFEGESSGDVDGFEVTVAIKDGSLRAWRVTTLNRRRLDGRVEAIVGFGQDVTEQKLTEQALERSEQRHRILSELAGDYSYELSIGAGGKIAVTYVSNSFTRISGHSLEETNEIGWRGLLHPDDVCLLEQRVRTLEAGLPHTCDWRIRTRSGETRWFHDSAIPIAAHGKTGEKSVIGAARDITSQRQAEAALQVRLRQQEALAEIGKKALSSANLQSFLSESVQLIAALEDADICELVELLPDGESLRFHAVAGRNATDTSLPRMALSQAPQIAHALESGKPVITEELSAETRFPFSPGLMDTGVVSTVDVVIPGPERPFGILGIRSAVRRSYGTDELGFLQAAAGVIAAAIRRARTESYLSLQYSMVSILTQSPSMAEAAPKLLETIGTSLESSLAVLWCVDDAKTVLRCENTWRAAGLEPLALEDDARRRGFTWGEGLPGEVWKTGVATWIADFEENPGSHVRTPLALRDRLRGAAAFPMGAGGKVLGVIEVFQPTRFRPEADLFEAVAATGNQIGQFFERCKAESALRSSEEQVRQSQKMEAVGRLAGGVAHDFNNLLTVIRGYTDLSIDTIDSEHPLYRDLDTIRRAAERASSLTNQLLVFSRRQVSEINVFVPNAVVADTLKMLQRLLGEDIELVTELAPELHRVRADPGQLGQVLLNLAVNSRDAMPRGGRLTIRTSNVVLPAGTPLVLASGKRGPHVLISVSDDGCGIPEDALPHVFEPFFTTKEPGKGTGLGLSIVYSVVQQSEGSLAVETRKGRGTTFSIYLPKAAEEPVEASCQKNATGPARGEIVLLVEDDIEVRRLARRALEASGYKVLEAASGDDALAVCEKHPGSIDLLLTDVVMPKMSGRELAEQLRRLHPETKTLFMSGYTDDALLRTGVLQSDVTLLAKPFTPQLLVKAVWETLGKNSA